MNAEKTEKQRYMVSVYEARDVPGTSLFTFVPRGLQQERGVGGRPQHIVRVREVGDDLTFDWSGSPDAPGAAQNELEQTARTRLSARKAWVNRVGDLVGHVEQWAEELGWSTRRVEKRIEDSRVGDHKVPALVMQEATVRVLLEPVSRSAPGAEGIVDLYLMPAYEDIASLYFREGNWHLHYVFPNSKAVATIKEAEAKPLSKETLAAVLGEMKKHGQ